MYWNGLALIIVDNYKTTNFVDVNEELPHFYTQDCYNWNYPVKVWILSQTAEKETMFVEAELYDEW